MVNMSGNKNNKNKLVFTCSRKIAKKMLHQILKNFMRTFYTSTPLAKFQESKK